MQVAKHPNYVISNALSIAEQARRAGEYTGLSVYSF
mgnify:CR=1 FL=1